MARIPVIRKKEDLPAESQAAYEAIVGTRGEIQGPFTLLLHSPQIAERAAHLGAYLRFESPIDPKAATLAILTVGRELDCEHIWSVHSGHARKFGVTEEAIRAIRAGDASSGLTPEEAQIVGYVEALLRSHRVTEGTFRAMLQRFGVKGLVELTATIGYFCMLACTLNAFELKPPPDSDQLGSGG
ncbi:MAG: carboxymuconolactone decarboxylase family protein [Deltaproteobacteria bacterium]|nr:carboxymuconolactone decarboxylase family protein [Deltaproteobacteria bacterium]